MAKFWIDLEDASGNKLGPGPITTAQSWESTTYLDKAGNFSFSMPASDPKSAYLTPKIIAHCYTVIDDTVTDIASGIIDKINVAVAPDGPMLTISGDNLLRELTYLTVEDLAIGTSSVPAATGPADIIAYAPAGWSLDAVNGYTSTSTAIYHAYEGETVLEALCRLAELTGEHFHLGTGRKVVWTRAYNASTDKSGLRAFQSADAAALVANDNACLVTRLECLQDSYDLVTRVYPYGVGVKGARVDLSDTTWTAPTGYSLDTVNNYIKRTAPESTDPPYQVIARYLQWKDAAASDTLAKCAYEWLRVHSEPYKSYQLEVAKHTATPIEPGKSIHVIYHHWVDGYHAVNIDDDLVVLGRTTRIDNTGYRSLSFQVATTDRYPCIEGDDIAQQLFEAKAAYTHPQPISGSSGATSHNHNSSQVVPSLVGVSVSGAITAADRMILAEGTINITLPDASTKTEIWITNIDTGTITIKRAGSNTINGSTADITLTTQYSSYRLISDGSTKWYANKFS